MTKEDIKFFKVIANYQLNEIPSLIKNILWIGFWVSLAMLFFFGFNYFVNYLTEPLGIIEGGATFFNHFKSEVNRMSDNFILGKIGLWGTIIFIVLMIFAKFDEDWFIRNKLIVQIPVLSWKLLIFLSFVLLLTGFILNLINGYIIWGILIFLFFFPIVMSKDKTFFKVAQRVYPDLKDGEKLFVE